MSKSTTDTRTEPARREAVPVLDFLFLIYPEDGAWIGRSILTSHISRGPTFEGALEHLVGAIDFAIEIAAAEGYSVEDWYEDQEPDEEEFLRMFKSANRTPRRREARSGRYVRREVVARKSVV